MKKEMAVLALVASGCIKPTSFQLSNGDHVECKDWIPDECGLYLGRCNDGIERWCQTNVGRIKEQPTKRTSLPVEFPEIVITPRPEFIKKVKL